MTSSSIILWNINIWALIIIIRDFWSDTERTIELLVLMSYEYDFVKNMHMKNAIEF